MTDFVHKYGGVYEHSPWVAEQAADVAGDAVDVETIAAVMTHPGSHARELRQVTPFAGALTPLERAEVYAEFRRDEAAA